MTNYFPVVAFNGTYLDMSVFATVFKRSYHSASTQSLSILDTLKCTITSTRPMHYAEVEKKGSKVVNFDK